ncbi:HotDog domain-containing protein [Dactylonectria estremocensis]|uniref:HotDog domain-containing protein n=1 Tax=Dactylonectria estremocensis TaxID=1079267 RepID=A0A9P9EML6_9HYPO|nr:HotDog domain-containing protein [Dactylonectria estremocensis]
MATSDLQHFLAIPWCAKLLNDPNILFIHNHENLSDSGKIRGLFAENVSSIKDGVKAQLAFYPRHSQYKGRSQARFPELSVMLDLGSGVSGWPGLGHGGFISHLFDIVAGQLAACNVEMLPGNVLPFTVTAKLEVNYRKPVLIDRVLILKTVVQEMEGRKMKIGLELVDESGAVLCDGMALFLLANGTRL